MPYFTQDFLDFFVELEKNNSKTWFEANKKRYTSSVKEPFEQFVAEMIARISVKDPGVQITPKEAIFRIYRDVRFSKDKTPYKTHTSAVISEGGRKNLTIPGTYIQFGGEVIHFYGGLHMLETAQLLKVRRAIAADLDGFAGLLAAPAFKKAFETLRGEQHKRIPPEFREATEKQPLLANKQFYFYNKMPSTALLDAKFPEKLMELWQAGREMNLFLRHASGV